MREHTEPVRSPRNPRIVAAARLHRARERSRLRRTLIEGPHVLAEALASGVLPETVFHLEDDIHTMELLSASQVAGADVVPVGPAALARVAGTEHPRGPVAVISIPAPTPASDRDVVLIEVAEPGNAGALIRSAAAFGFDVAFGIGSVDAWSPKVLRSAAGGHFHVRVVDASALADRPHLVSVVHGGVDPSSALPADLEPMVLVVGNEAHGSDPSGFGDATTSVTIPMVSPLESLNASVAGSILMYEIARQRRAEADR